MVMSCAVAFFAGFTTVMVWLLIEDEMKRTKEKSHDT